MTVSQKVKSYWTHIYEHMLLTDRSPINICLRQPKMAADCSLTNKK